PNGWRQRPGARRATDYRNGHAVVPSSAKLFRIYDTRIADAIVQRPFFGVKSRHEISDAQYQRAEYLREIAPCGCASSDLRTVGADYFEPEQHFPDGGAPARKKIDFVANPESEAE